MRLFFASFALIALPFAVACSGGSSTSETASGALTSESSAPIRAFAQVSDGLYRGGHPDEAGLDYLKSLGIKTIVDLEIADLIEATPGSIDDELKGAAARDITVVRFPMAAYQITSGDAFNEKIEAALQVMADQAQRPIFVHCLHGEDRTGLVVGLERVFGEDWAPADAYAEMLSRNFHPSYIGLDDYFRIKTNWEVPSNERDTTYSH